MSKAHNEQNYLCDPDQGYELLKLKEIPEQERNDIWYQQLLLALPVAMLLAPDGPKNKTIQGSDGFYYEALSLLPPEGLNEGDIVSPTSVLGILDYCLSAGVGIAIFSDTSCAGEPFWVIHYGALHSLKAYGELQGDPQDIEEMLQQPEKVSESHIQETVQEERDILLGQPSEEFLPRIARELLNRIFEEVYGFENVGVAIMQDPAYAPSRHLVLSLSKEDFADEAQLNDIVLSLQWHLPPHRPILLNYGIEEENFIPLKDG